MFDRQPLSSCFVKLGLGAHPALKSVEDERAYLRKVCAKLWGRSSHQIVDILLLIGMDQRATESELLHHSLREILLCNVRLFCINFCAYNFEGS